MFRCSFCVFLILLLLYLVLWNYILNKLILSYVTYILEKVVPSKNTLKLTRNCEANLLKVGKSQKVFSFPSYLQKNALNHSPSTFFMKWNSFWDLPTFSRIASLFLAYFFLMFWKGGGLFYLYYLNLHKKVSEQSFFCPFRLPFFLRIFA